jgi:hypothetical protein
VGADSCLGADCSVGADSGAGADSWVGADSRLDWGASAGGRTGLEEPEGALPEEWWVDPVDRFVAEDLAALEPGNALAATSESTAVSATLPAINQRLTRFSRRSAASRVCECGLMSVVMKECGGV